MEFQKFYHLYKIPDWYQHYFNYEGFHRNLKLMTTKSFILETEKVNLNLQMNELNKVPLLDINYSEKSVPSRNEDPKDLKEWIESIKQAIDLVNLFYLQKVDELSKEFIKYSLITDDLIAKDIKKSFLTNEIQRNFKGSKDELENATSWNRAYSDIFKQIRWMYSYCQINIDALSRIAEEFVTLNRDNTVESDFVGKYFSNKEFIRKEKLDLLKNQMIEYYAVKFTNKNKSLAAQVLDLSYNSVRTTDYSLIIFFLGMCISLTLLLCFLIYFPSSREDYFIRIMNMLPVFRFEFMLLYIILGLSINIYVFRLYGVNYITIFQLSPEYRIRERQVMKLFMILITIWLSTINFQFFQLKFYWFETDAAYFPIIFAIGYLLIFLCPFKMFYRKARAELGKTVIYILCAPFGPVRFKDFFLADIYCSLVKPFQDIAYIFCFYQSGDWKDCKYISCSYSFILTPIMYIIPYYLRFWQCIHKYYETREKFPHLVNAGKYMSSIVVGIVILIYSVNGNKDLDITYVIFAIISTVYCYIWDITMDWGLMRDFKTNFGLRSRIMFPKSLFYWCISSNLVLRFAWIASYVYQEQVKHHSLFKFILVTVLTLLEAIRRTQWAFLRVENENINNYEKYRIILEIPNLPEEDKITLL